MKNNNSGHGDLKLKMMMMIKKVKKFGWKSIVSKEKKRTLKFIFVKTDSCSAVAFLFISRHDFEEAWRTHVTSDALRNATVHDDAVVVAVTFRFSGLRSG